MELEELLLLAQQLVNSRAKHEWYDRVVKWAETYKALMTGEEMQKLLLRYVRREDLDMFEQRVALTIAITPAVCAMLMKAFNKVSRNDKIKAKVELNNAAKEKIIKEMADSFYGRKNSQSKGLDYWLKTRFPQLCFSDPNAWVVVEWDAPESLAVPIKPRPFEVRAYEAWNYEVENEDIKWLWVANDIMFKSFVAKSNNNYSAKENETKFIEMWGKKFTMYGEGYTITFTQVDKKFLAATNYELLPGEILWEDEKNKVWFLVRSFETKLSYVPAIRVGYVKDVFTDGATFVNGWHEAMPYLLKSVKTVSELDLTMTLHAFPQKLQYVQKCPGRGKKPCISGYDKEGVKCAGCGGEGYKVHTTTQDVFMMPLPDSSKAEDGFFDLSKMIEYKAPPVDLVKFQAEYVDSLKKDAYAAVFSSTSQTKTAGPSVAGGSPVSATEHLGNTNSVNDAVAPFAEKNSEVWIEFMNVCVNLAGVGSEDVELMHKFPADFKFKSMDELLIDLAAANASGAPSFLIDAINRDIAEMIYDGDEIELAKFYVKRNFYPFNGQTPDEIAMFMSSQFVSERTKILYANFEAIFTDIDLETPEFWLMQDITKQWEIVEKAIDEYQAEITATNTPDLRLGIPGKAPVDPKEVDPTKVK